MIEREPPWDEVVADVVAILVHQGDTGCAGHIVDFYCDAARPPRWRLGAAAQLRCRALLVDPDRDWTDHEIAARMRVALQAVQRQMRTLDEPVPLAQPHRGARRALGASRRAAEDAVRPAGPSVGAEHPPCSAQRDPAVLQPARGVHSWHVEPEQVSRDSDVERDVDDVQTRIA